MSILCPYCHSCGWSHKSLPGKTCKQKKWHKPLKGLNEDLLRYHRTTIGAYVPAWVSARVRKEAIKKGSNLGALACEILTAWAKKKGGVP